MACYISQTDADSQIDNFYGITEISKLDESKLLVRPQNYKH